jgi:hypothetical protein
MRVLLIALLLLTGCATYPQPGRVTAIGYDSPRLVVREGATYDGTGRRITGDERTAAYAAEFDAPALDAGEMRRLRWMIAGSIFDVATTAHGISRGCVEANPLAVNQPVGALLKVPGLVEYYRSAAKTPLSNSYARKRGWLVVGINVGAGLNNMGCG